MKDRLLAIPLAAVFLWASLRYPGLPLIPALFVGIPALFAAIALVAGFTLRDGVAARGLRWVAVVFGALALRQGLVWRGDRHAAVEGGLLVLGVLGAWRAHRATRATAT